MNINVKEYDVVTDGKTLTTNALQAAIDNCHESGGGVVTVEAGQYLTGSLDLKSNVELYLSPGCEIIGSSNLDNLKDFISKGFNHKVAPEGTCKYLIGASHASNVAITGPGTINASGLDFYDQNDLFDNGKFAKKPAQRPRLLMMHQCQNIRLTDSTYQNSPCWTVWLMMCEKVNIRHLTIVGDWRMRNNDGIDFDSCKNVTISDCDINTDDDCIVLRAIQKLYDTPAICENVTVTNCNLKSTCQCIRVSCPSDHIVRNCTFNNLNLSGRNGINFDYPSMYLAPGTKGSTDVSNIAFSDLTINCQVHPIRIEVKDDIELKRIAGLAFSNIRINSQGPCVFKGNKQTVIEDISLSNIQMQINSDQAMITSNCKNLKLNNVEITEQSN